MNNKAIDIFQKTLNDSKEDIDVVVKVQKAMTEMNKQILKDFSFELRLDCIIGLVNKSIQNGNNVDYTVINELLHNDTDGYEYNLMSEVNSLDDLISLRDEVFQIKFLNRSYRKCICKKCNEPFNLSFGEVEFYRNKNFPLPKTCKYCKKGIEKPKKIEHKPIVHKEEEYIPTAMEIALRGIKLD